YTDVDVLTDVINRGHIYKLLLKPWNDQTLKLEVKRALEYYELMHTNKLLHNKILEQNNELKNINEKLERMVKKRTEELEIQNQVLELSRAILEYIPLPIIGISKERIVVYLNHEAENLSLAGRNIVVGHEFSDYYDRNLTKVVDVSLKNKEAQYVKDHLIGKDTYDIDITPLSGNFSGRGVILSLRLKTDK
ncbi:MAG TPA: hypothetical protein VEF33_03870, partial [Syntrophales bacterium]|nr:hypothetical protein [Syntrophales bacterium]